MEKPAVDVAVFKRGPGRYRVRAFEPATDWNSLGSVLEEQTCRTAAAANKVAASMGARWRVTPSKLATD